MSLTTSQMKQLKSALTIIAKFDAKDIKEATQKAKPQVKLKSDTKKRLEVLLSNEGRAVVVVRKGNQTVHSFEGYSKHVNHAKRINAGFYKKGENNNGQESQEEGR